MIYCLGGLTNYVYGGHWQTFDPIIIMTCRQGVNTLIKQMKYFIPQPNHSCTIIYELIRVRGRSQLSAFSQAYKPYAGEGQWPAYAFRKTQKCLINEMRSAPFTLPKSQQQKAITQPKVWRSLNSDKEINRNGKKLLDEMTPRTPWQMVAEAHPLCGSYHLNQDIKEQITYIKTALDY
jgi:hypothetical protein